MEMMGQNRLAHMYIAVIIMRCVAPITGAPGTMPATVMA